MNWTCCQRLLSWHCFYQITTWIYISLDLMSQKSCTGEPSAQLLLRSPQTSKTDGVGVLG